MDHGKASRIGGIAAILLLLTLAIYVGSYPIYLRQAHGVDNPSVAPFMQGSNVEFFRFRSPLIFRPLESAIDTSGSISACMEWLAGRIGSSQAFRIAALGRKLDSLERHLRSP